MDPSLLFPLPAFAPDSLYSSGQTKVEVMIMEKRRIVLPQPLPNMIEKPIPAEAYVEIDTDLARDNLENDLTEADKQNL